MTAVDRWHVECLSITWLWGVPVRCDSCQQVLCWVYCVSTTWLWGVPVRCDSCQQVLCWVYCVSTTWLWGVPVRCDSCWQVICWVYCVNTTCLWGVPVRCDSCRQVIYWVYCVNTTCLWGAFVSLMTPVISSLLLMITQFLSGSCQGNCWLCGIFNSAMCLQFVLHSCKSTFVFDVVGLVIPHLFPFSPFPFFHWLYLFSSSVHPFPFYQNSPTPFPGRRS